MREVFPVGFAEDGFHLTKAFGFQIENCLPEDMGGSGITIGTGTSSHIHFEKIYSAHNDRYGVKFYDNSSGINADIDMTAIVADNAKGGIGRDGYRWRSSY
ncbi:hypothetical protein [Halococcus qingdaonensis]|uniref:hypothetical protein n=1 Tax=Halococcus qingdaonensis TaxID=224402 RepID=UPI0021166D59|nr:hypothetical protein [Halococcus qingdaonensis]